MRREAVRQDDGPAGVRWSVPAWVRLGLGVASLVVAPLVLPFAPRPALEIVRPQPGERVGIDGAEVLLRFREASDTSVTPPTFRVRLNGADVTDELTRGENGASGRVNGLLDGENVLEIEVFGRALWPPGLLTPERREVHFLVRRPLDFDRG